MPKAPPPWVWFGSLLFFFGISEPFGGPLYLLIIVILIAVISITVSISHKFKEGARPLARFKSSQAQSANRRLVKESKPVSSFAPTAKKIASLIPAALSKRSGSVFYTGPSAFESPSRIYILGLNPGGDPVAQSDETIERDVAEWLAGPPNWSAYADESWQGAPPGTWGMQPRMLHMFNRVGLDARSVPASNVVFVRSRDERAIAAEKAELLRLCWPVHQAVIDSLGVDAIICLGNTAGKWVRGQVGATDRFDSYQETNARGWTAEAHRNAAGLSVITVSHPGRQNWISPDSDPSDLIVRVLKGRSQRTQSTPKKRSASELPAVDLNTAHVNEDWRKEHLNRLHNGNGKAAYAAMRGAESLGLTASPNTGAVAAVRLHDRTGRYLFSYIVNRADLLFYVRKPTLSAYDGIGPSFSRHFSDGRMNSAGEWTLKIPDAATARQVVEWLKSIELT